MQISDEAYNFLKPHLDTTEAKGIRLEIKGSGCSGYKLLCGYFDGNLAKDDKVFNLGPDDNQITVVVDSSSFVFLEGTTINLVQEGLNTVLSYDIPKATGGCGCGSSYSF